MNLCLDKYEDKKKFGIFLDGILILNQKIINSMFFFKKYELLGGGQLGEIDGSTLKKNLKS